MLFSVFCLLIIYRLVQNKFTKLEVHSAYFTCNLDLNDANILKSLIRINSSDQLLVNYK